MVNLAVTERHDPLPYINGPFRADLMSYLRLDESELALMIGRAKYDAE
jgi:hypothetical protein